MALLLHPADCRFVRLIDNVTQCCVLMMCCHCHCGVLALAGLLCVVEWISPTIKMKPFCMGMPVCIVVHGICYAMLCFLLYAPRQPM